MARSSRSSESISAPCHGRHGPSTRLITPQLAVTLGPGRPSAITSSPTLGGVSARRLAVGRLWPASFKTARSVLGSRPARLAGTVIPSRSEEHTSELQSHSDLVCRLLLEKKKNNNTHQNKR